MKNPKLKTKLVWEFELDEEIPTLDIDIPLKKKKDKETKIVTIKKNKNVRDSSTNTRLF